MPIGFDATAFGSAAAFGGSISTYADNVSISSANGSLVLTWTVIGSITWTSVTGFKSVA